MNAVSKLLILTVVAGAVAGLDAQMTIVNVGNEPLNIWRVETGLSKYVDPGESVTVEWLPSFFAQCRNPNAHWGNSEIIWGFGPNSQPIDYFELSCTLGQEVLEVRRALVTRRFETN
jgi:hypothetical protein